MFNIDLSARAEAFLTGTTEEKIILTDDCRREAERLCTGKTVVFSGTHYAGLFRDKFPVFTGIEAEPATPTVERMIAFLRAECPDTVIAIGGGSVMDAAKTAWICFQTGMTTAEVYGVNKWSSAHPGETVKRIIAIPTTNGSGSETTPYANIVEKNAGVKKLISETAIIPAAAIIDPALSAAMPRALVRTTGLDAMAHLLEGFLNIGADRNHPEANAWTIAAIELGRQALPEAMAGNPAANRAMAITAALGGRTIRYKSTGLPHLCSFSWFGRIAHGEAVAMLLPECWRYYLGNPAVAARTMELNHIFPGTTPEEVIGSYEKFLDELGMPAGLAAWDGITAEIIEKTARSGAANPMKLELAPRPVPLEQSYDILKAILKLSL